MYMQGTNILITIPNIQAFSAMISPIRAPAKASMRTAVTIGVRNINSPLTTSAPSHHPIPFISQTHDYPISLPLLTFNDHLIGNFPAPGTPNPHKPSSHSSPSPQSLSFLLTSTPFSKKQNTSSTATSTPPAANKCTPTPSTQPGGAPPTASPPT